MMKSVEDDKKLEAMNAEASKTPKSVPEVSELKKAQGRGRPKSKPDSKLASFHLPLDLISKIDAEAAAVAAGNKSLFLVTILNQYFADKNKAI
ncbi:MAG TPA: hypothetical protein VGJ93_01785 [Desulfuromonadaceae bacterium]|jgi:hypothetical protein